MPTAQRSALSGVTMTFGMANLVVDLLPATVSRDGKSGARSFKLLCPDCDTPTALKQTYGCSNPEHGPFLKGDAVKGIEGDNSELRKVTAEDLERFEVEDAAVAAKQVAARRADLHVYPADQVEAATLQAGTVYRLRPQSGSEETYALMMALVADDTRAFLCEVSVKNVVKLYRARVTSGVLSLLELARPADMYPAPIVSDAYDVRLFARADELAAALIEDFDGDAFTDARIDRMARLRATIAPPADGAEPLPVVAAVDDLLAALDASLKELDAA